MKNLWIVLAALAVFFGTAWLWGNHKAKDGYARGRAEALDSVLAVPTVVTLPDTVYVTQGHVWTPVEAPKPRQDAPQAPRDTLALPVVADTPVVLRDDSVKVSFRLSSSFDRRTLLFTHEFKGITVSYPREVHFVDRIEYRGPHWWERPLIVISAVGAAVCIQREEWAGAACFGAAGITLLTVDF